MNLQVTKEKIRVLDDILTSKYGRKMYFKSYKSTYRLFDKGALIKESNNFDNVIKLIK